MRDGERALPLYRSGVTLVTAVPEWLAGKPLHKRTDGYVGITLNGTELLLHRLLLEAKVGQIVDHINGDKLDNRLSNLRICSNAENTRNRVGKIGRSLPKGVVQNANRFQARLYKDGKKVYLGSFKTAEEAARAYDLAAVAHFGDFARLNNKVG